MKLMELKYCHWSTHFTILKFLTAKIVWEGHDTLSQEEEFLLVQIYSLLDSNTNYDFVINFRPKLIKLSHLFHIYIRSRNRIFEGSKQVFQQEAELLLRQGVLPSAHAYFGWANLFNVKRFLRVTYPNNKRDRRIKRFIGVGYKDKGTMKNIAEDCSPSWQEVAAVDLGLPPPLKETDPIYELILTNWEAFG